MSAGILLFIFAILTVILIHEAGHFVVAKFFDFKATKFFIGFGPPLWSFTKGETEYGIAMIPAGGFVKIVGMNPYEEVPVADQPRAYPNKPAWQRALVIVAGSGMHWIIAFVLIAITLMTIGFPTGGPTNQVAVIETRIEGHPAPASAAGFELGDRVVAVEGRPVETWSEVRAEIRANAGEDVTFSVLRGDERLELDAELGTALFAKDGRVVTYAPPGESVPAAGPNQEAAGFLGIQPEPGYEKEAFPGALASAGRYTAEFTGLAVLGIGDVFAMVFGGELWDALRGEGPREIDEGPLGLVGGGRLAGQTIERDRPWDFLMLIVGFTIFVGLMNLLPLPPLDGGHLAVIVWEKITGRRVDVRKLIPIAAVVISFFVILFVAVLYLDLARPIRVPF